MTDVSLYASMADDLSVVNSARVSFGKHSTEMTPENVALINFLMRERHGTPFEHNSFTLHVRCPIFVAREWFRHRIGSFNEFSARYTEMPEGAWVPPIEDVRSQVGKPGAYTFTDLAPALAHEAVETIKEANDRAYRTYKYLLGIGVAKEVARTVLPMGTFTEFFWTVNARSLMNFLSLRTAETAQQEIRQYALTVEDIFRQTMPVTHQAWVAHGRIAP